MNTESCWWCRDAAEAKMRQWVSCLEGSIFRLRICPGTHGDAATCPLSLAFIDDSGGGVFKCPSVLKPGKFSCCSANLCMSRKAREWIMLREKALLTDLTLQPRSDPESFLKTRLNNSVSLLRRLTPFVSLVHFHLPSLLDLEKILSFYIYSPTPPKTLRLLTLCPKYQSWLN